MNLGVSSFYLHWFELIFFGIYNESKICFLKGCEGDDNDKQATTTLMNKHDRGGNEQIGTAVARCSHGDDWGNTRVGACRGRARLRREVEEER